MFILLFLFRGKNSVFPLLHIKLTVVLINENALDIIQSLVTLGRRPNQTEPWQRLKNSHARLGCSRCVIFSCTQPQSAHKKGMLTTTYPLNWRITQIMLTVTISMINMMKIYFTHGCLLTQDNWPPSVLCFFTLWYSISAQSLMMGLTEIMQIFLGISIRIFFLIRLHGQEAVCRGGIILKKMYFSHLILWLLVQPSKQLPRTHSSRFQLIVSIWRPDYCWHMLAIRHQRSYRKWHQGINILNLLFDFFLLLLKEWENVLLWEPLWENALIQMFLWSSE